MSDFVLDRGAVIPELIQNPEDFLIVTGLAGTARDIAGICGAEGTNYYSLAGAMGGAVAMGLGLALAQPNKRVLCVTGDGELLMNVGALATVAVMNPANFGIICVDNGHYGETGNQVSHTGHSTDLAVMASGAGIKQVRTVAQEGDIADAAAMVKGGNATFFVHLKVNDTPPKRIKRSLDANYTKTVFRKALLGEA
jgi:thiamine pyrophosphate-dependent acetolactate synthase large subunit-like protein